MSIHLYAACWNEERIIPFFLRHYEPLVDRIIIYDDHSTDRSVELLRASPKVEVRPLQREAESYLDAHLALFETCWRESRGRADWVCFVDLDEFLFHPDWHCYLDAQKEAGVTIIQALGYDMVSETFPPAGATLATSLTRGRRDLHLDKTGLFALDAIEQINHSVGRHRCSPVGRLVLPARYSMQLRHYKTLGLEYLLARTHALATRLTGDDLTRGWSAHYLRDDDSIRAQFQEQLSQARPVPPPSVTKPNKNPKKEPWWRRVTSNL
ncbi:MAG: glycosyltransferase family 2 protein [Chthoniobacterales bacterium]|nr:MAG: glycosyltransferase family 2 protein [Chthoniobacterales bacterium]